jgi:SAM-dependent methyltransferase
MTTLKLPRWLVPGKKKPKQKFDPQEIVVWGRTLDEYEKMFALTEADRNLRILDCGAGPASFNAEMTALGHKVVSIDPVYNLSPREIEQKVQEARSMVTKVVKLRPEDHVWKTFKSIDDLIRVRMHALSLFLPDFEKGRAEGRYFAQGLPKLDFPDNSFDLVLVSHFLFLHSTILGDTFDIDSMRELTRVGREVRIFPLFGRVGKQPKTLPIVIRDLESRGYEVTETVVDYEFIAGGNKMLTARPRSA